MLLLRKRCLLFVFDPVCQLGLVLGGGNVGFLGYAVGVDFGHEFEVLCFEFSKINVV